jgi:hypothetical protein
MSKKDSKHPGGKDPGGQPSRKRDASEEVESSKVLFLSNAVVVAPPGGTEQPDRISYKVPREGGGDIIITCRKEPTVGHCSFILTDQVLGVKVQVAVPLTAQLSFKGGVMTHAQFRELWEKTNHYEIQDTKGLDEFRGWISDQIRSTPRLSDEWFRRVGNAVALLSLFSPYTHKWFRDWETLVAQTSVFLDQPSGLSDKDLLLDQSERLEALLRRTNDLDQKVIAIKEDTEIAAAGAQVLVDLKGACRLLNVSDNYLRQKKLLNDVGKQASEAGKLNGRRKGKRLWQFTASEVRRFGELVNVNLG